jgi:hypothetical protein
MSTTITPYKGREIGPGPVEVYRNLHRAVWSIKQGSRVVAHAEQLLLRNCTFKVLPGGLARYRVTGIRNVHAFIVGEIAPLTEAALDKCGLNDLKIRYRNGAFRLGVARLLRSRNVLFTGSTARACYVEES